MFTTTLRQISSSFARDGCKKCIRLGYSASPSSHRTLAYVSNKRITRIPSETAVDRSELKGAGNEATVGVKLVNRNPRNLEQMLLAEKPMGHELDSPNRHYWNKVVFEKKSKCLVGKIVHYSGQTVLSVSSNEATISSKVPSALTLKAAQLVGQILALRALESGIHSVYCDYEFEKGNTSKVAAFINAFAENGITLEEQAFIFPHTNKDL